MAKKPKGSGEKLFRTKAVGVRLDPKLKYAAELAARKQRRTLSSFIEWAIQEAVNKVPVTDYLPDVESSAEATISAAAAMRYAWDTDDADRLAKLAIYLPDLMTHDEQVLWKRIHEHPALWRGKPDKESNLHFDLLRKHFETFKKVAKGELDEKVLEKVQPKT